MALAKQKTQPNRKVQSHYKGKQDCPKEFFNQSQHKQYHGQNKKQPYYFCADFSNIKFKHRISSLLCSWRPRLPF
jgi:hypothetical protein